MNGEKKLSDLFDLQEQYQALFADYRTRGINRRLNPNDKEFIGVEPWRIPHYFDVGADALRLVITALSANLRAVPQAILDFPSGSGRVTRHLRAFFPQAHLVACDLYEGHIAFCRTHLGVEAVMSKEDLDAVSFGRSFDLIFCGSLLTHLPEAQCRSALRLIARSLSDVGIALITLSGRHADFIQKNLWKLIDDDLFVIAQSTVPTTGFGYVDYDHNFRKTFDKQARYGITLTRPSWTMKQLEADTSIRVLGYAERAWDDHQDVLIIGRPGINAMAPPG